LAEAENTTENLSTALIKMNIKTGKTTKRVSILTGQLEKTSLSLIMIREKEAAMILKIRYTICRLVILKV
jgi:hypothetical protein